MALRNDQYDLIMREYSRRQSADRHILQQHESEAYSRIPELMSIDRQISGIAAAQIRESLQAGKTADTVKLREQIALLEEKRRSLLVEGGFPEDYLELPSHCPICADTGYLEDGSRCACFRQLEIGLLYGQEHLSGALAAETFDSFSLDWYADDDMDNATGLSSRELAVKALQTAKSFTSGFDDGFSNLFFYGDTGVGKTFLSHCIANELIKSGHSVLYFSSFDLFDKMAGTAFDHDIPKEDDRILFDCDLLIIDDLGTELTNAFVSSRLFLCINERLTAKRSTVISTNLTLHDFSEVYSERTFSRIASAYHMCKLIGKDIRIQKKLNGGY